MCFTRSPLSLYCYRDRVLSHSLPNDPWIKCFSNAVRPPREPICHDLMSSFHLILGRSLDGSDGLEGWEGWMDWMVGWIGWLDGSVSAPSPACHRIFILAAPILARTVSLELISNFSLSTSLSKRVPCPPVSPASNSSHRASKYPFSYQKAITRAS